MYKGIKDITDALPFESRASNTSGPSSDATTIPKKLVLPPCPRGPDSPIQALSEPVWKHYLSRISVYMGEWHKYNSAILQHFHARNANAARFGTGLPSSEATKLLEMSGEFVAGEPVGIRNYLKELKEDEEVRRQWSLACQRHYVVVRHFVEAKDKIARAGFTRA